MNEIHGLHIILIIVIKFCIMLTSKKLNRTFQKGNIIFTAPRGHEPHCFLLSAPVWLELINNLHLQNVSNGVWRVCVCENILKQPPCGKRVLCILQDWIVHAQVFSLQEADEPDHRLGGGRRFHSDMVKWNECKGKKGKYAGMPFSPFFHIIDFFLLVIKRTRRHQEKWIKPRFDTLWSNRTTVRQQIVRNIKR